MKRSRINTLLDEARQAFAHAGHLLPEWADWSPDQWQQELASSPDAYTEILDASLGWDVTDFGSGDYDSVGLLLFTLRNGTHGNESRIPYAEKLMLVKERQVTPTHFHRSKTEDIINRGGGELVLELHLSDDEEKKGNASFAVHIDGVRRECEPGTIVRLKPGQSITLYPYLYHSFWAEGGTCIVGEVSSVNDDDADNRFLESGPRYADIDEDAAPTRLLCNEYAAP